MVIIGAGRIGTALAARASERGVSVTLVGRDTGWEAIHDGVQGDPVWVATRNDDIAAVVARTPAYRKDDLVFVQNGAIRGLLRDLGVAGATRGLLYFAVASRGGPVHEGLVSPFCGPHALASARFLGSIGLKAHALDWGRFGYYEWEKLLWLALNGLLCTKHGCTVGEVAERHSDELRALVHELGIVARAALGVDAPTDFVVGRLIDYSRTIPGWSAAIKERTWRDGWLLAAARAHQVPTSQYDALCRELGVEPNPTEGS